MYSVDCPFIQMDGAAQFMEEAAITDSEKKAIAHGNAEKFLGL